MPNVVRFALSSARDLYVPDVGWFDAGFLDVPTDNLARVARVRFRLQPYGVTEIGIVDSSAPKPELPAAPAPPPVDPFPMYLDPSEVFDSQTGKLRSDKVPERLSESALRAASGTFSGDRVYTGIVDFTDAEVLGIEGGGGGGEGYAALAGSNLFTDPAGLRWGPAADDGTQLTVRSAGDGRLAVWQVAHDAPDGYILHLTQKAGMGAAAALIGLGVDEGGRGLFVNNKKTGQGVVITQNDTITSGTAYGLLVQGSSSVAPGAWFGMGIANAKPAAVFNAGAVGMAAGTRIVEFRRSAAAYSDTLVGYVKADDGALAWEARASFQVKNDSDVPMLILGTETQTADLHQWFKGSTKVAQVEKDGTLTSAVRQRVQGAGAQWDLYDTAGTSGSRRFGVAHSAGYLIFRARDDNNSSGGAGTLLAMQHATGNLGVAGITTAFAGGAKVIGIPEASTVPTANPTGGGVMYVEGGALKYRGTAGTVTTLGPA